MAAPPLTVTGASLDGETVGLRCEDGSIAGLGPDVRPEQGDETIDAAGAPLVAPLLNGHTHAAMTLFRGYGGDLPLMRWLREKVWPVEAKLEAEDVYWGARLACVEMVRTGTAKIANCIKFSVQQVENLMQFVVVGQFELGDRRTSCCCAVTHTS